MDSIISFLGSKYGKRTGVILLDMVIVILSYFGFHGEKFSSAESAIWVLVAVCFVRLGVVLQMLRERDEVQS